MPILSFSFYKIEKLLKKLVERRQFCREATGSNALGELHAKFRINSKFCAATPRDPVRFWIKGGSYHPRIRSGDGKSRKSKIFASRRFSKKYRFFFFFENRRIFFREGLKIGRKSGFFSDLDEEESEFSIFENRDF